MINVDDRARRRAGRRSRAGRVTYAIDAAADVRPGPLRSRSTASTFDVRTPRGTLHVRSPLVGRPNVYNILAAAAAAMALDLPFTAHRSRASPCSSTCPADSRSCRTPATTSASIVDYAHTDDALKNLLETARPLAQGRVITVFGCGGDRDRTKRPLMGAVAARLSDLVIVTSDNPRSEDPDAIIEEIRRGIVMPADRVAPNGQRGTPSLADRRSPRSRSRRRSARRAPAIWCCIAGKGHEKYQVIGDRTLPFDDVEVARAALARRRSGSRVIVAGGRADRAHAPQRLPPRPAGGWRRGAAGSASRRAVVDRLRGRLRRASCSSRCAASGSTATSSSARRWPPARPARW